MRKSVGVWFRNLDQRDKKTEIRKTEIRKTEIRKTDIRKTEIRKPEIRKNGDQRLTGYNIYRGSVRFA